MAETLEWFQCKACGRRHRWQADIAGTEIECQCGAMVLCPQLELIADADPSDTAVDPASSAVRRARGNGASAGPAASAEAESFGPASAPRTYRGGGLSPFTKALLWSIGAAVGFIFLMYAIIDHWKWYYVVATVLWTPFSFIKFTKARKRWQGNRSLKRAFLEQVDTSEDDDEAAA